MTVTLFTTELRRLTSTKLGVLAFVALMTVPLVYGGMYLWGNLDPYSRLGRVPAAIVVADTGARGADAATALERSGDADFHRMSAAEARTELADGGVDFVVTFPADFSRDLASAGTTTPTRAAVQLTTNDANGYLSSTIAKQLATAVRDQIAARVGQTAASRFLVALADTRTSLSRAADGAGTLATGAAQADTGAASLTTGAKTLASGAASSASGAATLATGASSASAGTARLASGLDSLATGATALSSGASSTASGAAQVADGDARLAAALQAASTSTATTTALAGRLGADGLDAAQIAEAIAVLTPAQQALAQAAGSAKSLATGASEVASGAAATRQGADRAAAAAHTASGDATQLAAGTRSVATGAAALARGTAQVSAGAGRLAASSAELQSGVHRVATGAASLHDQLGAGVDRIPATTAADRRVESAALSDPVSVAQSSAASAGSYGAGLAPLFLSLSAWIGAYALFLILRPLSRRAITAVRRPVRVVLAGWLTPALLGAVQMAALFGIAAGPLGLHIANPVGTVGVLLLTAGTFAAILLLLNAALGSVGQFLGLLLMLVQLVTAGGTFPWQTLPAPLAAIHHALPMSYAVDALRQAMYGGDAALAWGDAGVLAGWLLVALALTVAVAARMTRHRTLRDLQPSLIGA